MKKFALLLMTGLALLCQSCEIVVHTPNGGGCGFAPPPVQTLSSSCGGWGGGGFAPPPVQTLSSSCGGYWGGGGCGGQVLVGRRITTTTTTTWGGYPCGSPSCAPSRHSPVIVPRRY